MSAKIKKPTAKQLEKLRENDEGFVSARDDAVSYMQSRRQAAFNIARRYRLDPEELFQESYEVLLTCLRDYTPVYEKDDKFIEVQFNTFFGSRLESRAMEMRNRDPEYQARQAVTDGMSVEEKERFRSDPPLLVQHLDHESPMQEHLSREVSMARADAREDIRFKIMRDSFFDRKLSELVSREKDEKKQAALLHVKVGGVYNFQEIAYHFGVTDSRASQVMNELMDAFYVQRLLDGDLESVANDFAKLKFNEKRVLRLLKDAIQHAGEERREALVNTFKEAYKDVIKYAKDALKKSEAAEEGDEEAPETAFEEDNAPPAYEEVFGEDENEKFPLLEVGLRPISSLKLLELEFRPPEDEERFQAFVRGFDENSPLYPIVVSEEGYVIDGERRLRAAQEKGKTEYLCLTRKFGQDFDRKLMRVVLNMRLHKSNKIEMYYAIRALSSLGLSQQKIADHLGTSRTNVLVYCKVRDKASPILRGLFEDGYIQITNASTCVDLDDDVQADISAFIRRYGLAWSKGAKFNKLFAAAAEGKIDDLEATLGGKTVKSAATVAATAADPNLARKMDALEKQLETYAKALKDAEVWASQREAVINNQREQLNQTRTEADTLKRELDAAELMKFGNSKSIEDELKQVRQFYQISERMAGAHQGLESASQAIRRTELRRSQIIELVNLLDGLEKNLNDLRLEIHNRGTQLGVGKKVG